MAEFVLESERLGLRLFTPDDAQLLFEKLNSPALMEYLGGVKTHEQVQEKNAKTRAGYSEDGFGFMAMVEKSSGEIVGQCGMKRVSNPLAPNVGTHEIGWLVREDRWRMGYAGEAMRAVIDWAFRDIGAPHLVALTCEANVPSWKLMEKLGMVRREDLDFTDPDFPAEHNPTIQYSINKTQWETSA